MRKLLLMASTAAFVAASVPAKADTFVYTSASTEGIGTNLTISGTINGHPLPSGDQISAGQIGLVGSRNGGPTITLPAWCVDVFDILAPNGSYNIVPLGTGGAGGNNPMLTLTQINQMGALMVEGNMAIANNTEGLDGSAAFQLAIWAIEYNGQLLDNADGFLAGVVTQLVANVEPGGIWANVGSTVDLLDAAPANQVLAFAVPSAVPLPAALPMFLGGLGILGLVGRGKRRSTASAFDTAVAA